MSKIKEIIIKLIGNPYEQNPKGDRTPGILRLEQEVGAVWDVLNEGRMSGEESSKLAPKDACTTTLLVISRTDPDTLVKRLQGIFKECAITVFPRKKCLDPYYESEGNVEPWQISVSEKVAPMPPAHQWRDSDAFYARINGSKRQATSAPAKRSPSNG